MTLTRRRFVVGVGVMATGTALSNRWARSASGVTIEEVALDPDASRRALAVLSPVPIPHPVSHLGVRWAGAEEAGIELRWRPASGDWGGWQTLRRAPDLGDPETGTWLTALVIARHPAEVQVRRLPDATRRLTLITIAASDPASGEGRPARGSDASPPAASSAVPEVVSRRQWAADESRRKGGTPSFAPVRRIAVHHTATPNDDPDPAATVRAIYAYHTQANGWDDIGYNFLVDAAGRIYEGRFAREYGASEHPTGEDAEGRGVIGAHTLRNNLGTVGVAMLGDFDEAPPSDAARDALERLLTWKARRHDIDPRGMAAWSTGERSTILGHRDTGPTACPGGQLYAALASVRRAVADRLAPEPSGVSPTGYWVLGRDGGVTAFGERAQDPWERGSAPLGGRAISMASTPSGEGYWILAEDGRVIPSGDARALGSTQGLALNGQPISLGATPSGRGYWVAATDGGVFAFGDAPFLGSAGGLRLRQPIVMLASHPAGQGYWLAAADGGVFSFGGARFFGSAVGKVGAAVVALAPCPAGDGYWLLAADGRVVPFGAARFFGDLPTAGVRSAARSVRIRATPSGRGYYLLGADGGLFAFGDAPFLGSSPGRRDPAAAVDLVLRPASEASTGSAAPSSS